MKWDVLNQKGEVVGSVDLDSDLFGARVHKSVLAEAIKIYQGNQRQGTADTKERGEVSKSTRKPWRQKGTGSARAGMASSPIWRGGGIVFGPTPRSYRRAIPRKVKRLACQSALSAVIKDKNLRIIDTLDFEKPNTKSAQDFLNNIKVSPRSLIVVKNADKKLLLSMRNIKQTRIREVRNINALHILEKNNVVFTQEAILDLTARLKAPISRKPAAKAGKESHS